MMRGLAGNFATPFVGREMALAPWQTCHAGARCPAQPVALHHPALKRVPARLCGACGGDREGSPQAYA